MAARHNIDSQTDDAPQGDLEDLIGYNLKRAYLIVSADFRRTLGLDGFAPRVFSALSLVVEFPNITQSELARMLKIERSGLVAIIDELEGRKLLQRIPVPRDRRIQALAPTSAGRAAYARARDAVKQHEEELFADFSGDEKATLLQLLRKIRATEE